MMMRRQKTKGEKAASATRNYSLLDMLPSELISSVLSEWLSLSWELILFDLALTNRMLREKYLTARKYLQITIIDRLESFNGLVRWSRSRNIFLQTLSIEYDPIVFDDVGLDGLPWSQLSYLEHICIDLTMSDFNHHETPVSCDIRINLPSLLRLFPNLTSFNIGLDDSEQSSLFDLYFDITSIDSCPGWTCKLDEFIVRKCRLATPQDFTTLYQWMSIHCPQLSFFVVDNCINATPKMILEIMSLFPNLQYITYYNVIPTINNNLHDDIPLPLLEDNTNNDNDDANQLLQPILSNNHHHHTKKPFFEIIISGILSPHELTKFTNFLFIPPLPSSSSLSSLSSASSGYCCHALKELTLAYLPFTSYQKTLLLTAVSTTAMQETLEYITIQACVSITDYEVNSLITYCAKQLKVLQLINVPLLTDAVCVHIANLVDVNEEGGESIKGRRSRLLKKVEEITFTSLSKITNSGMLNMLFGCSYTQQQLRKNEEIATTTITTTSTASAASAVTGVTAVGGIIHTLQSLHIGNNIMITNDFYYLLFQQIAPCLQSLTIEETDGIHDFDETKVFAYLTTNPASTLFIQHLKHLHFEACGLQLLQYPLPIVQQTIYAMKHEYRWNSFPALSSIMLKNVLMEESFMKKIIRQTPKLIKINVEVAILWEQPTVSTRSRRSNAAPAYTVDGQVLVAEGEEDVMSLLNFSVVIENSETLKHFVNSKKLFASLMPARQ